MLFSYNRLKFFIPSLLMMLSACSHDQQPGIETRIVTETVEVQKPCPGTVPTRPGPLGPLASDTRAALAQVLAKLAEWSGEGKYGDQAEAYFETCPPEEG